jgi:hypothetical protein
MKLPLRFKSIIVAGGLLCLGSCCPAYAGKSPEDGPQSTGAHESASKGRPPRAQSPDTVIIPGPLRSFLRMAGISQEIPLDEVLPMLARNASLLGYRERRPTEYLVLVNRYVHQARELELLVDTHGDIRLSGCQDAARLIEILGYKVQGRCGQSNAFLATGNSERAFVTIDSGFPLTLLEQSLQKNAPFTYAFAPTRVPVFFSEKDWVEIDAQNRNAPGNLIDMLLHDQDIDRLYWALARCDQETRLALMQSPGLRRLVPLAPVFGLYGSGIAIRSGSVVLPGGTKKDWEDVVGTSANSPGDFVFNLLTRDRGWLAAYFDALSHLNRMQQAHLSEGTRLRHLYDAYRSTAPRPNAGAGVFPRNAELLILFASLKWDASGDPQILEGLGVWNEIFSKKSKTNSTNEWPRQSRRYDTPERFLEMLVASCNFGIVSGPVQIFLTLEAMNAGKPEGHRLSDPTELLVANRLPQFNHWFSIFAEFPALDDGSLTRFVNAADRIDGISNAALRANALGAMQANIGLWQILARQGQIPNEQLNTSWQNAVQPFMGASSTVQTFEAARASLQSVLVAATGKANLTQDQIVDLLAGPTQESDEGQRVHQELVRRIHAVLDDQRLVSLDTLFGLYDGFTEMAHGANVANQLLPLAGNLREFEMPRPVFSGGEKSEWSPIVYTSRHAELQARTDLTKILRTPASPAQLEAARGQLTPFLRDSLVGLNYAYYEPPGAEVLHNNPLFVRSHDFSSISVQGIEHIWGPPGLIGVGATAGGGAYLMGSLADLPFALATTEQDFIAPKNIQALIWKETVPGLLVSAVLPRWWAVSQGELHSAALYQRAGEEILTASATNAELKAKAIGILSDCMTAERLEKAELALRSPDSAAAMASVALPAETFYLAVEFRKRYSDQASMWGPAGRELEELSQKNPTDASVERLSADFGTPHPALLVSDSRTLLNTKPLPLFGGPASRLLAESWESNNLYWARLADEKGYSPVMLNILIPALTRHMVSNIFASNIDDWPALMRAMQETGDEFRQGKITVLAATTVARQ